jgi:carbonic anhydrase/acetyltransferase-like protein (isoleucine patch superfamily)
MIYNLDDRRVQLSDHAYVAPNASLIGSVTVEDMASIWFNVIIRADNDLISIGAGSNIQDGSVLHVDPGFPLTVGSHVTVGHKVILHGCSIGDGSLIGMNAVVLNGARIGRGCLIGANTLITENMQIPDGSVVLGSPGKIVRTLDEATRQKLLESAQHYIENGRRYRQGLKAADAVDSKISTSK